MWMWMWVIFGREMEQRNADIWGLEHVFGWKVGGGRPVRSVDVEGRWGEISSVK